MNEDDIDDTELIEKFKKENAWGFCTSIDLKECNPDFVRDAEKIREFVIKLCDLIEMRRFSEPIIVDFGENEKVSGFSFTQLIETSLLSGHFVNQTNAAYIDIFSCKEYPPKKAAEFSKEFFQAKSVKVNFFFRY